MAQIIVNGKQQEVNLPINVAKLIKENKVLQPDMVSIQLNEEFLNHEDWKNTNLKEGDVIDFLYFMGGGCN
jgi:sulfur carrier protein